MTNTIEETTKAMAEQFAKYMPKITTNKNGYEIRTKVLEMAKDQVAFDFNAQFSGWEQTIKRDPKTNEVVSTVTMPTVPGVDAVLEAAEKFYAFVSPSK